MVRYIFISLRNNSLVRYDLYCHLNMPYVDVNMCDEGARSENQLILSSWFRSS